MKTFKLFTTFLIIGIMATSCSSDDDGSPSTMSTTSLELNLNGLSDLGPDFVYEGWIIVAGTPVSTGTFTSITFPQNFTVNSTQLASATKFVLSIEPIIDTDPAPSATKILAGDFSGASANVTSNIVGDFSTASGTYILATPTDGGNTTDEFSGVWFLDNSSGSATSGLLLPTLASGWKYEGWVVVNGTPISTGTFSSPDLADDNATTSLFKGDAGNGPSYPGEDYLQNAPTGFTFPMDVRGSTVVVSVEPYPDNNSGPFTLKPLAHMVPVAATDHSAITMELGPVQQLTGSVLR